MSLPSIKELKQKIGLDPNFVIMFMKGKKCVHMAVYENEPSDDDINNLYEELNTNPDFGLVGKAYKLDVYQFTKGEYKDLLIENKSK